MMLTKTLSAKLLARGFDLFAVLGHEQIKQLPQLREFSSLLVIGNSGPQMWRLMPSHYRDRDNPVDDYARESLLSAVADLATTGDGELPDWQLLYPVDPPVACPPLQQLGQLAGWHHASPLGTGINQQCGLWFAYRMVVGLTSELPAPTPSFSQSPCIGCESLACTKSCPAGAISVDRPPQMVDCAAFRLRAESPCAATCLSRLSCPVQPHLRYSDDQLAHHYQCSLPALQQWLHQTDDHN